MNVFGFGCGIIPATENRTNTQPLHKDGKVNRRKDMEEDGKAPGRQQYGGALVYTGLDAELKTRGSRGGRARRVNEDRSGFRDKEMCVLISTVTM